jgi:hypothetical protein
MHTSLDSMYAPPGIDDETSDAPEELHFAE